MEIQVFKEIQRISVSTEAKDQGYIFIPIEQNIKDSANKKK